MSFAVLLLGVGLPLWWHTTAVPRVALPYTRIDELSQLDIKINTKITVAAFSRDRAELLAREIKRAFVNAGERYDKTQRESPLIVDARDRRCDDVRRKLFTGTRALDGRSEALSFVFAMSYCYARSRISYIS